MMFLRPFSVFRADAIVFAYVTGYLAQSTFEGGAKLAAKARPP